MKTSEFKNIMNNLGLEVADVNNYTVIGQYVAVNKKIRLASISTEFKLKFSIFKPFDLSDEAADAIIEYAKTPIDERSDKTYNIEFTEQEINGLVDALNTSNVQVIFENSHYEAKFKFHDLNGFNAFIDRIVSLYNVIKSYEK